MCASIRPVAIDGCFEVVPASSRWTEIGFSYFLSQFFFWYSFIDVYCAKTIMEICYALGAMKKNFMAFLLLSTTRCYFFSLLFFMRQRKKIYCNLKKNFLFISLWWNWEVFFPFYFACVKRSSILEYKGETFMLLFFNLN